MIGFDDLVLIGGADAVRMTVTKLFAPVTALQAYCSAPLIDMMATGDPSYSQVRQPPFKPNREHFHHIMQRIGFFYPS
ncbi:hypothetical protein OK016_10515 [Vibrio chagasii]|nr:hypothetical protein [Vibrio chagasii]